MESLTKYILLFIALVLLQILVFNNVPAIGLISPYLYVAFIILLPITLSKTLILLLAFVTGLIIDLSISTIGIHASASVMLAALRPAILNILSPSIGYEKSKIPILSNFGFLWTLKYTLTCVLIHHVWLYICFSFSFQDIGFMLFRLILNIILTVFLIMVSEFFFFRK